MMGIGRVAPLTVRVVSGLFRGVLCSLLMYVFLFIVGVWGAVDDWAVLGARDQFTIEPKCV